MDDCLLGSSPRSTLSILLCHFFALVRVTWCRVCHFIGRRTDRHTPLLQVKRLLRECLEEQQCVLSTKALTLVGSVAGWKLNCSGGICCLEGPKRLIHLQLWWVNDGTRIESSLVPVVCPTDSPPRRSHLFTCIGGVCLSPMPPACRLDSLAIVVCGCLFGGHTGLRYRRIHLHQWSVWGGKG